MTPRWIAFIVLLFGLTIPSAGLADAVGAPPEGCPKGSEGEASHQGTWCAPSAVCKSDESCKREGRRCRSDVGICVKETRVRCGGKYNASRECFFTKREVVGNCESQSDCSVGGTCVMTKRCVKAWSPTFTMMLVGFGVFVALILLGLVGIAIFTRKKKSPA